jgi:undecaprenyl-diphosphatase
LLKKLSSIVGKFDRALLDRLNGARLVKKRKRLTAIRDITALGGDAFLIVGGLLACALQATLAGPVAAAKLFAFLALGRGIGWALKAIFRRQRPSDPVAGVETFTSSFPSIHTLSASCLFTAIGFVSSHGSVAISLVCGAVLAALVGSTRLIFRVHWPSDVIVGYALGLTYSGLALAFML